jgi:hypothetical protein
MVSVDTSSHDTPFKMHDLRKESNAEYNLLSEAQYRREGFGLEQSPVGGMVHLCPVRDYRSKHPPPLVALSVRNDD